MILGYPRSWVFPYIKGVIQNLRILGRRKHICKAIQKVYRLRTTPGKQRVCGDTWGAARHTQLWCSHTQEPQFCKSCGIKLPTGAGMDMCHYPISRTLGCPLGDRDYCHLE